MKLIDFGKASEETQDPGGIDVPDGIDWAMPLP